MVELKKRRRSAPRKFSDRPGKKASKFFDLAWQPHAPRQPDDEASVEPAGKPKVWFFDQPDEE